MSKKLQNFIKFLNESKYIVPISFVLMSLFIVYYAYLLQEVSSKNGYEELTLMSIVSMVIAFAIYGISSVSDKKIFVHVKNILIIILAVISIISIMKLKFEVHELQGKHTAGKKIS